MRAVRLGATFGRCSGPFGWQRLPQSNGFSYHYGRLILGNRIPVSKSVGGNSMGARKQPYISTGAEFWYVGMLGAM